MLYKLGVPLQTLKRHSSIHLWWLSIQIILLTFVWEGAVLWIDHADWRPMTQILINAFEINIQNSRRNLIMPRPTGTLRPGTLAISYLEDQDQDQVSNLSRLSSLRKFLWGDDAEKPILQQSVRPAAIPYFLERGQITLADAVSMQRRGTILDSYWSRGGHVNGVLTYKSMSFWY